MRSSIAHPFFALPPTPPRQVRPEETLNPFVVVLGFFNHILVSECPHLLRRLKCIVKTLPVIYPQFLAFNIRHAVSNARGFPLQFPQRLPERGYRGERVGSVGVKIDVEDFNGESGVGRSDSNRVIRSDLL